MSAQEWQCIRKHVPNFLVWPEIWMGCLLGAVSGVLLLETILKMIEIKAYTLKNDHESIFFLKVLG